MPVALDVSDIVQTSVNIAPTAIPYSNFGTLLVLGNSDVIDTVARVRQYSNILQVAQDFSGTSPEYLAGVVYFSQTPQPNTLFIGRYASTATHGFLHGALLTASQQVLGVFTAITTGALDLVIDGVTHSILALNLSSAVNLNGVASIIQTAVDAVVAGVSIVWNATYSRFEAKSGTTGTTSNFSVVVGGVSGDISAVLGFASGTSSGAGIAIETPLSAVTACANASSQWYDATFATGSALLAADAVAVASFILASSRDRLFGLTLQDPAVLDPTQTNDVGSQLQALGNKRVFWQYSSTNAYAVVSLFARAATVNFNASMAAITLKFKQEPGVVAETLTETQAATVTAKGGNVFVAYNNGASIIQPGQMANGYFFDEVHNLDWYANAVQTDVFNLLYQSTTKIPQTDGGANMVVNVIEARSASAVTNGVAAPGQWNAGGFGQLVTGQTLSKGYYVYVPPMATQSQADRETRILPPVQIAIKMAGAVHDVPIIVNVNR